MQDLMQTCITKSLGLAFIIQILKWHMEILCKHQIELVSPRTCMSFCVNQVDTPDTEQDSFDMGDLPPPPPPLPSLNGSISNDFPPPPFIEMMGKMSVDMGTPIEEGHQADEPLPSPPRLPLESVQRVPMSDLCATCGKKGRRGLLWLCCDGCQQWYHRSCAGISVQAS